MAVTEALVYSDLAKIGTVNTPLLTEVWDVTFDASYATGGGEAWDAAAKTGLTTIVTVEPRPKAPTLAGYKVEYDYTDKKFLVYAEEGTAAGGPLLEEGAADLSTLVCRVVVRGLRT